MTNLLLDTHVMVWCVFRPELLSGNAEKEILHARRVFVPGPALYEAARAIATKRLKGATDDAIDALPDLTEASGFELLHPDANDWLTAAGYGWTHGDPFDKLICAMAEMRSLALVTADEKLLETASCTMIDAR